MIKKSVVSLISSIVICVLLLISASATLNNNTENDIAKSFSDVSKVDWFYEDIQYVCKNNLMCGTSEMEFSPLGDTTRGMIVTVLWRLEGEPKESRNIFNDVKETDYFYNAVAWATKNQIVSGYNEREFGPNDVATREQLATIMYRYAVYKKYDVSKEVGLDKFADKNQISEYAVKSIKWANANGIISGTSNMTISPLSNVQRAQLAAILNRFCVNIKELNDDAQIKEESENEISKELETIDSENTITDRIDECASHETNDSVLIDVGSIDAKPGDEVVIAVDLKNNPGILGMILTLYYDEDICTLESAENGNALKDILDMTTSKVLENGCKIVWDGVEISESDIKDGEILKLKFKIKEDTPEGICPITIKYFNNDIIDNNLSGVHPIIKNGEIIISK